MQNSNTKTNTSAPDPIAAANAMAGKAVQGDFVRKIVDKIKSSENILIALSRDPSVDEIAAAIGLTLFLDGKQKHVTAIYSGRTPKNLDFLQPSTTFEQNTASLQDFIISLSKDKADHLRYKLEGDFVKIFITPYKTQLSESDLTFSHGDYNVDFVIAINVPSAGNLDEALREHGRIMHDASVVNITTGQPGRFGEIEWSNPAASSLCEMITELVFAIQGNEDTPLDKDVATALLTGIVAATDRFSNERTNSDTLSLASKLMSMGADQKLITANVHGNEIMHNEDAPAPAAPGAPRDRTNLAVEHGAESAPRPATATPGVNPAAQAAPSVVPAGNAAPPTVVTATNNVAPESVVVQPVIPGAAPQPAPTPASAQAPNVNPPAQPTTPPPIDQMRLPGVTPGMPAAPAPTASSTMAIPTPSANTLAPNIMPNAPAANAAPAPAAPAPAAPASDANTSRPMATSAPAQPDTRQVGSTIQPPAPKPQKPKNYAEMLEEALSEPDPSVVNMMNQPAQLAAPASDPAAMNLPNIPAANTPAPAAPAMPAPAAAPITTPPATTPPMEPVANPMNGAVLPPPPAPVMGADMMPPVLPPVQM